jgi:hypothetical protein
MKKTLRNKGFATIEELRGLCLEADVHMLACQMTVDVFGLDNSDFIPEVTECVGATSVLPVARKSDVCCLSSRIFSFSSGTPAILFATVAGTPLRIPEANPPATGNRCPTVISP